MLKSVVESGRYIRMSESTDPVDVVVKDSGVLGCRDEEIADGEARLSSICSIGRET